MSRVVEIIECDDEPALDAVRTLWREYWNALGFALDFQGFSEELAGLPGKYAPPRGCLLLARAGGYAAGTAALRALSATACEGKRLYVDPARRHCGIASALLSRLIHEARRRGYRDFFGDTLPDMTSARDLYRGFGFEETSPYSDEPTPGAVYLRLSL